MCCNLKTKYVKPFLIYRQREWKYQIIIDWQIQHLCFDLYFWRWLFSQVVHLLMLGGNKKVKTKYVRLICYHHALKG